MQKEKGTIKIDSMAESLYRLEATLPGGRYLFTVYFIKGGEGGGVLIEPGPAGIIPSIQEGMKSLGLQKLSHIIPTHIHLDHGGGSGELAAFFPQAKVVVHPRALKHMLDPSRLIEGTRMAYGDNFEALYGAILPVPESQLVAPEDGDTLNINGRELQMVYAPGHAPHQIAIFDKKTEGLFCGEALGIPLSDKEILALPAVSVQDFNPDLYLETIEKLKRLNPRVLYYSHQGYIHDPEQLIEHLIQNIRILLNVIFEELKRGKTVEAIQIRVGEMLSTPFDRKRDLMGLIQETVLGFATYYRRKGLL